jgi:hypothetical protein
MMKDSPGDALHALLYLTEGHDFHFAGLGARRRYFGRESSERGSRENQDCGNGDLHGVDNSS